jgi:hypothetical protein
MFMCNLNLTSDTKKRLGYVNPNLINHLPLNAQINANGEKYKNMIRNNKINAKKTTHYWEKVYGINLLRSNNVAVSRQRLYHGPI